MINKKYIIPMVIIVLVVVIGIVKINIINTKALSPMGNSEENYALVSKEFGEDFAEFIKDNAEVKIYTGEGNEDPSIKIKDKEIQLKKENPFIKGFVNASEKIKDLFMAVKGKVDGKINDINKSNKENKNEDLDSTVNDFINNREKNNGIKDNINDKNNVDNESDNINGTNSNRGQ